VGNWAPTNSWTSGPFLNVPSIARPSKASIWPVPAATQVGTSRELRDTMPLRSLLRIWESSAGGLHPIWRRSGAVCPPPEGLGDPARFAAKEQTHPGKCWLRRESHGISIMVYYWRTCGYHIDGHLRKPGGAIENYESGELRRKSGPRSLGPRYLRRQFRA